MISMILASALLVVGPVSVPRAVAITWDDLSQDDQEFLDMVERKAFEFFWYEVNESNGLIANRANVSGGPSNTCSIASVGFGLSAICVADERGWITHTEAYDRVLTTLKSFHDNSANDPDDFYVSGSHGLFRHFVNMDTGQGGASEISLIDTALLIAGVIHAGQHFKGTEVETLADEIYRAVEWDWMQIGDLLKGTDDATVGWRGYDEYILAYFLAIGSPTHPPTASVWDGYCSTYRRVVGWPDGYTGDPFLTPGGQRRPLAYLYQFPACWIDFRWKEDDYAYYWQEFTNALTANRQHCINENPKYGYPDQLWGWTACDGPDGYQGYGSPYNGTVSPSAVATSTLFDLETALTDLKYMYNNYPNCWREDEYGFVNSFNPYQNWYARGYVGIDQGNLCLIIEGARSGQVWKEFMQNPYMQNALDIAGFTYNETTPPTPFDLISPENGATVGSATMLTWEAAVDAETGIDHYDVWINDAFVGSTSDTSYPATGMNDGLYTWYVVAYDVAGNSTQSTSTYSFAVDSTFMPELGDVDGSGAVNIIDALQVARYDAGIIPNPFYTEAADVDCNSEINIIDALQISRYDAQLIGLFSCG